MVQAELPDLHMCLTIEAFKVKLVVGGLLEPLISLTRGLQEHEMIPDLGAQMSIHRIYFGPLEATGLGPKPKL